MCVGVKLWVGAGECVDVLCVDTMRTWRPSRRKGGVVPHAGHVTNECLLSLSSGFSLGVTC